MFFLWTKYSHICFLRILEPELGLGVQDRWWNILFWFHIYNSCKDPHKNGIWEVPRMADDVCFIAVKCKLRDMNIVHPIAIFPLILKATHQLGDRLTGRVDVPDHPASWLGHRKFMKIIGESKRSRLYTLKYLDFFILTCGKIWFFIDSWYIIHTIIKTDIVI